MTARFRIAPTPSGLLHEGNLLNFILTSAWAIAKNGAIHLRIDDLDSKRVRGVYYNDILDSVQWLGLKQFDIDLQEPVYQAYRGPLYQKLLDQLREHNLVYACTCSRKKIKEDLKALGRESDINDYPGTCREMGYDLDSDNVNWRIKLPEEGVEVQWREGLFEQEDKQSTCTSDFVVKQRNGKPAYQLASLVDDCVMEITHVVRGVDLLSSTIMQLALAQLIEDTVSDKNSPYQSFLEANFWHHELIRDRNGDKLSKSKGHSNLLRDMKLELAIAQACSFLRLPPCGTLQDLAYEIKKRMSNS